MRFKVNFKEHSQRFAVSLLEQSQQFKAGFDSFQVATKLVGGEPYIGAYEIRPQVEPQTLETKHKVMTDDLTICEIPYAEVTNLSGGMTATIG